MSVNLKKVAKDLAGEDEDVRILALTTVVQLTPGSIEDPADLPALRESLAAAVDAADSDTVFLARKGLNHLDTLIDSTRGGTAAPAPAPAPDRVLGKAEALEVLANERDDLVAVARALTSLTQNPISVAESDLVLPLLEHADARVRANAVEVLEATEDEKLIIQNLSGLLEDENNRVRANASKALGRLGAPKVRETLGAMLASTNIGERESAVYAMSFLKGGDVIELLLRALRDPYEGVRLRVVRALARQKDPRAIPALQQARNDMDIDVCEEADRALRFIQMEAAAPTREGYTGEGGPAAGGEADGGEPGPAGSPEAEEARAQRTRLLLTVGQRVFELCRKGGLAHADLDRSFYDALKAQEFLRKHRERAAQGGNDFDVEQAVKRLEQKIRVAFGELAQTALGLASRGEIRFEAADEAGRQLAALDARLGGAGR